MIKRIYVSIVRAVALVVIFTGLIILAGCSPAASAPAGTSTGNVADNSSIEKTGDNSDVYSIAFYLNGKQMEALTIDDLLKLDQITIDINGSPQNGPTLLSVLKRAGIDDFSELTAYGMSRGRLATAETMLKREQVDDTVMLDMNKRGKCKLCGANIPQSNWIIDIEKIEAR
jgi:hypothetical protein